MRNFTTFSSVEGYNISDAVAERYGFKKKPKKAKARAKGGCGMTRLFLLLLLVLLAPVNAQAGVAEQSLTHANAKVRAAVLHDVCEVHGNEKRDQLDAEDRAAYASILKELQRSLDTNDDPEVATQTFCEFGRRLQKPPAEPHKP
jgi:hypothetical protein